MKYRKKPVVIEAFQMTQQRRWNNSEGNYPRASYRRGILGLPRTWWVLMALSVGTWLFGVETGGVVWAFIGAVLIFATLIYLVWYNWRKDSKERQAEDRKAKAEAVRREQLATPCPVEFLIPEWYKAVLGYVKQDDQEHRTSKLVVPPHSKVPIILVFKPLVPFRETDFYLGCKGDDGTKPEIVGFHNPFILRGAKDDTPETNQRHYIDFHHYYHIQGDRQRLPDETYVPGFWLETHSPGLYRMEILWHGTERLGRAEAELLVDEPNAQTTVQCSVHGACDIPTGVFDGNK